MTNTMHEDGSPLFLVMPPQCEELLQALKNTHARIYQITTLETETQWESPEPGCGKVDPELLDNLLKRLGIPRSIQGFRYIQEAVKLVSDQPSLTVSLTKQLYPAIAETFGTKPYAVERAIRYAVETAWTRCDAQFLEECFGNTADPEKGKPTNGEFITQIAHQMTVVQ